MPQKQPNQKPKDLKRPAPPPAPPKKDAKSKQPAGLQIVRKSIASLVLDPRNARHHSQRDIEEKKKILTRYGQQKPIVIDAQGIIRAGNGFVMAARELGWTEIDCVVTTLTTEEAVAYGIADNRAGELSDWDTEALFELVASLTDESLLTSIGFDAAELEELVPAVAAASVTDDRGARLQRRDEPTVRLTLYVAEVAKFEAAMEMTGEMNRSKALLDICDFYVNAKRQLHTGA